MATIILLSIRETFRKKIFALAVAFAVIYAVLFGLGAHFVVAQSSLPSERMLVMSQLLSVGLYFGSLLTGFLSIITAVGAVSADIESGVMHSVLARPLRRQEVILGKFAGLAVVLCPFAAFLFLGIAFVVKFVAGFAPGGLVSALAVFCLQPLILVALAVLGSTSLNTVVNGAVVFMLYLLAIVGGMLQQIGALIGSVSLLNIGVVSSLILPADAVYRKVSALVLQAGGPFSSAGNLGPFGSQSQPSVWMMVYIFVYIIALLFWASRVFARRDI